MDDSSIPEERPTSLTQPLKQPINIGTATYNELTVKEPTAGQWKQAMEFKGFQSTIMLISLTSGIIPAGIEKMPISVVNRAGEFLLGFLQFDQETGVAS